MRVLHVVYLAIDLFEEVEPVHMYPVLLVCGENMHDREQTGRWPAVAEISPLDEVLSSLHRDESDTLSLRWSELGLHLSPSGSIVRLSHEPVRNCAQHWQRASRILVEKLDYRPVAQHPDRCLGANMLLEPCDLEVVEAQHRREVIDGWTSALGEHRASVADDANPAEERTVRRRFTRCRIECVRLLFRRLPHRPSVDSATNTQIRHLGGDILFEHPHRASHTRPRSHQCFTRLPMLAELKREKGEGET
mmetsp:Transcript_18067/g.45276  ORF Transcript_18067/g.45276 Transcript_18067/m.45276 type:complete len:249 (+) Transcript_18067:533-1279(+)